MKSTVRIFLVYLLLAFTMCRAAVPLQMGTETEPAGKRRVGRRLLLEGVPNFADVTSMLYRGGQPTHNGFERLAQMGIDIVVDTGRSKRDEKQIKQLGMLYVSLPWHCPCPKDDVFGRFLKLIKENPDKKIFVHCRLGIDRTGMMVAVYRMGVQGWTAQQAMKEMHSYGFTAVHYLICPGLAGYEKSFPERVRKNPAFQAVR